MLPDSRNSRNFSSADDSCYTVLEGLEGVLCIMDDVLVFGSAKAEHDKRLFAALEQIQKAGITYTLTNVSFGKTN